jgi:hypothetical protein
MVSPRCEGLYGGVTLVIPVHVLFGILQKQQHIQKNSLHETFVAIEKPQNTKIVNQRAISKHGMVLK